MAKPRKLKEERNRETREALLQAAAQIVGEHGYAGASVQRITEETGIAQGTFYLHFESRQHLFDALLPFIAHRALAHLRDTSYETSDFFQREERSFKAFFAYLLDHPYYYRVLSEAETMAPLAFEGWFKFITDRYAHSIERAIEAGEVTGLSRNEVRFMSVILLACRRYVYQEFVKTPEGPRPLPGWVTKAYIDMIRRSLSAAHNTSLGVAVGDKRRKQHVGKLRKSRTINGGAGRSLRDTE